MLSNRYHRQIMQWFVYNAHQKVICVVISEIVYALLISCSYAVVWGLSILNILSEYACNILAMKVWITNLGKLTSSSFYWYSANFSCTSCREREIFFIQKSVGRVSFLSCIQKNSKYKEPSSIGSCSIWLWLCSYLFERMRNMYLEDIR